MIAGQTLAAQQLRVAEAIVSPATLQRRLELGSGEKAVRRQVEISMAGRFVAERRPRGTGTQQRFQACLTACVPVRLLDRGQLVTSSVQVWEQHAAFIARSTVATGERSLFRLRSRRVAACVVIYIAQDQQVAFRSLATLACQQPGKGLWGRDYGQWPVFEQIRTGLSARQCSERQAAQHAVR
jgi:hypothetical protein